MASEDLSCNDQVVEMTRSNNDFSNPSRCNPSKLVNIGKMERDAPA